jgi:ATP-dependent RNA helicase DeaD
MDHLRRGTLSLAGVKTIVIDEADEMLRMGFIDDVEWWMRANPLVSVEVDEVVSPEQWMSVIVRPLRGAPRYARMPERARIRPHTAETARRVVGARLRENNTPRHTAPGRTGLLPHSRSSDYRPPRHS